MNGLKGIIGLIALAYFGVLTIKLAQVFYTTGFDLVTVASYGVWFFAYGGFIFASFATRAYKFSCTPVYYVAAVLLMGQITLDGWRKAVELSADTSVVDAQPAPVDTPPHPHAPAPSPPIAAVMAPPPPKPATAPDVNTKTTLDGPSGPLMITPDTSKYLNQDHIRPVQQPIPVPDITTTQEETNNAIASP